MEQANEPLDFPTPLQHLHKDLLDAGHRSRDDAEKYYYRAVDETVYKAGDIFLHLWRGERAENCPHGCFGREVRRS
jgi:hypothetical protein